MTRRGRSTSEKCAVGSSCTSSHSPDDPQGTLPCNYLSLSPNPPPKRYSSISYRTTVAFGADTSPYIGLNMAAKIGRDNEESSLYTKQPSPCERPRFPSRYEKIMPLRQLTLSEADRMECVRAEARVGISKANLNKDVAVPAPKTNSRAPAAQTGTDSPQQSKEAVETEGKHPLSALIAQWDREKEIRKAEAAAKRARPCGITEKLLLAFSILDLTVRLVLLATLWCYSTRYPSTGAGGGPQTIQETIAHFLPPATVVGLWRWVFADSTIGEGGAESDRILEQVKQTDKAALGMAGALMVSLVVHVTLSWVHSCEGV